MAKIDIEIEVIPDGTLRGDHGVPIVYVGSMYWALDLFSPVTRFRHLLVQF